MNINIYARASSMAIDDATCNVDHLPLASSPPLRRFLACIPHAFTSLVTKPYSHPSRRHLLSSHQLCPALITNHPRCSDSTPAH